MAGETEGTDCCLLILAEYLVTDSMQRFSLVLSSEDMSHAVALFGSALRQVFRIGSSSSVLAFRETDMSNRVGGHDFGELQFFKKKQIINIQRIIYEDL